jgi:hypothetical protein
MKRKLVAIVLSFIVVAMFGTVNAQVPATERAALAALYNSTDGDNWNDSSEWKRVHLAWGDV